MAFCLSSTAVQKPCAGALPVNGVKFVRYGSQHPRVSLASTTCIESRDRVKLGLERASTTILRAVSEETGNGPAPPAPSEDKPVVKIDNKSDSFATIVVIQFGDRLGDLLDTIGALKNLGLNIQRAKLQNPGDSTQSKNKFYVTEASSAEKVTSSARLEEIRQTILNNMLTYHPEAADSLSKYTPSSKDPTRSLGAKMYDAVETEIDLEEDESNRYTVLRVKTRDRPGLLVDMVHILKDISVNVLSAEIDTVGDTADDTLLVTYHGEPLNPSMQMLAKNALQYYLSLAEIAKDESY